MNTITPNKFVDEAEFKEYYRRKVLAQPNTRVFNIETEETVKGFPDTMLIGQDKKVTLYEFKMCDLCGSVKFTFNQPRFYREHADFLDIYLVAYDSVTGDIYRMKLNSNTIKGQVFNIKTASKL